MKNNLKIIGLAALLAFSQSLAAFSIAELNTIQTAAILPDYTSEVILSWDNSLTITKRPVKMSAADCGAVYLVEDNQEDGYQFINKMAPDGTTLAVFGSEVLTNVRDIQVNCDNYIYVLDQNWNTGDQVLVYDSEGLLVHQYIEGSQLFWQVEDPQALVTDTLGNIYILDAAYGQAKIVKLSAEGYLLDEWSHGGEYNLLAPTALAIDRLGNIYVADFEQDWSGSKIIKYDANGLYLATIRGQGTEAIYEAVDFKITSDDRIIVNDQTIDGNSRLLLFDTLNQLDPVTASSSTWSLFQVSDVAAPDQTVIYMLDAGRSGGRIIKMTSTLPSQTTVKLNKLPGGQSCALAPSPARHNQPVCLFTDLSARKVKWHVYNLNGEKVAEIQDMSGQSCWDTTSAAPGVYLARLELTMWDGSVKRETKKIAVIK